VKGLLLVQGCRDYRSGQGVFGLCLACGARVGPSQCNDQLQRSKFRLHAGLDCSLDVHLRRTDHLDGYPNNWDVLGIIELQKFKKHSRL
jgi:hypothetical protein